MRPRVSAQTSTAPGFAAVVAAVVLVGCAQVSTPGMASTTSLAGTSSFYSVASSSARSTVYTTRTISFALDRIDQRSLPLDQTYSHSATGTGVTVYVFDGGEIGRASYRERV